ncbi:MAG: LamG-like jellyroll fold domain-containing protein [Thermoguttaceae bacterium]
MVNQKNLFSILLVLGIGVNLAAASSPLDDAAAVWSMREAKDSTAKTGSLGIEGKVKLGVELTGAEREASLRRGGDGRVAKFDNGYLRAAFPGDHPHVMRGKQMTLYVRLQDPTGNWAAPLFSKDAPGDEYANILYGRDGSLHYIWRTEPIERRAIGRLNGGKDFADGVLRLRVPVAMIDPARWHDVIVRFRGPNLELFVDGVLVDEEWPHGELYGFCGPFLLGAGYENGKLRTGFRGQIDHAALWNRALNDNEIVTLAGGAEEVARRDREILGPPQASIQYWKPRGYNAWAGDCMPFYHDGTFHLFYLFDRHHHGSKWGQGAHQYAHALSKDLVHWEHHPLAIPIVEQWECSMGTCDCIWHNGLYHMFYTDCGSRCEYKDKPQRGSWIFAATSADGIHFHKDLKPLLPGGDCTVFRDPATGLFHLIRGGGNRCVSKDLRDWQEIPGDFVERKPGTSGECPHQFQWNGWFYFILGTNAVWKSRSALGPWEEMKPTIYDGLFVPKVAEFTGNRRILAGFLFERGWAGHLALRELIQYADGSLGIKFPPELIPASGASLALPTAAADPDVLDYLRTVKIEAAKGFAAATLSGVPKNVRLTLRIVPQPGAKAFGLCLRGKGRYDGGCELRFEPGRQRVQYGVPENHGPAKDATDRIAMGRDFAIENVENLDRPFTLDIVVKDDIIDTCIDQRRTMITRRIPEPDGDRLFFFAQEGDATFEDIAVRPLVR